MIRRPLYFIAFALIAKCSVAQNSKQSSSRSFNGIFDSLIINDNSIPVFEYKDSLPAALKPGRDSLVFDTNMSYRYNEDFFQQLLDNPIYTDKEKINFITGALRDHNTYKLTSLPIEFWKKNYEARQIMFTYSKKDYRY